VVGDDRAQISGATSSMNRERAACHVVKTIDEAI
jgi:hypothetical protein